MSFVAFRSCELIEPSTNTSFTKKVSNHLQRNHSFVLTRSTCNIRGLSASSLVVSNRTKCLQHEQLFESLPSKSPTATSTYLHRGDIGMARILCKSTRRSLSGIRERCTERRYLLDKGKNSMARSCSERMVCVNDAIYCVLRISLDDLQRELSLDGRTEKPS